MAIHSSILAWETPWTEEPGGLQSTGLQRVRHDQAHTCPRCLIKSYEEGRGFLAVSHLLEYERVRGCLNLQEEFNLINTKQIIWDGPERVTIGWKCKFKKKKKKIHMKFLTVKEKLVLVLSEWSLVGVRSLGYLDSIGYIFSSIQLLSHVRHFETSWTAAHQASVSITNSRSLLKFMSIEALMPSNQLILCHPLLLLSSIFPSIRVFSNESVLCIRWPKYWNFTSASVLPMNIQD